MLKPTQSQHDHFTTVKSYVTFANEISNGIRLFQIDEIPPKDGNGRRRVDGFKVVFEAVVGDDWTNLVGTMHGAAAAWIVDTCTSATIGAIHTDTFWGPPMWGGVSLTMDIQYLNPAPVGTELLITCVILRCSSSLANLQCDISDRKTGKLYVSGTHVKYWKEMKTKAKL